MRFAGIDIAAETHVVALVDAHGAILAPPMPFHEDSAGYQRLRERLGSPADLLVALDATGHSWQTLFAYLVAEGFAVALLTPLRTRRFAEEALARAKADAIDAVGLARFAAQKRTPATRLPEVATEARRELVRWRDRLKQDLDDRVRHLHRLVDLGFPEFTRDVRTLDSQLATALLRVYPTAAAYRAVSARRPATLVDDGRHPLGRALAHTLLTAAQASVGRHHGPAYQLQVRQLCEDIGRWRQRLGERKRDIARVLDRHEVGRLVTTIAGIGALTAARLVATLGDLARVRDAAALAASLGVVPGLRQSGTRLSARAGLTPIGHARLRAALWMPTLTAVPRTPWLRASDERLRARGKLPKVALVAAMRALLHAIYSVAVHRRPFVPVLLAPEVPA